MNEYELRQEVRKARLLARAEKAARMLENCQNYLEFDMFPRLSRQMRPVRVTVQWADRDSPAQRAAKLADEVERLRATLELIAEPNDDVAAPYHMQTWARAALGVSDGR